MAGTQSISGIISGLDTTEIVDALISFERTNAARWEEQQTEKTNQITTLTAASAKFLALSTSLSTLRNESTFEKSTINVSDEAYLTATSTGAISAGSYDLRVLSVAREHKIVSQGIDDATEAVMGTGTISIKVGDGSEVHITVDETNNSLVDIKDAINNSGAAVSASIINDGTSSNSYRLLLTADATGADNQISITTDLSDGIDLIYDGGSFDSPEEISRASTSTAEMSLGASAAYTGSENKTYTFTVGGSGVQTVGTDTIILNWTDGTDSGSIEINAEDTEVELTGDGADGLFLQLSAGDLTAGDTFDVNTFTPELQAATDARVSLGSADGSGAPITVTSDVNTFTDLVPGVNITVNKTTGEDESVTVATAVDTASIKSAIESFIDAYNDVMDFVDDQNTYDEDSGESGVLFGDLTLWTAQNTLRRQVTSMVDGLSGEFSQLYSIGIRHDSTGQLAITDSSAFNDAINNNLDEVVKLFGDGGESDNQKIEFVSLSKYSQTGAEIEIDITAAATHGHYEGASIDDPSDDPLVLDSTNNRLRLKIDGVTSQELILEQGTYSSSEALVAELQEKINSDPILAKREVTVEWESNGTGGGSIRISSGTYGENSSVELVDLNSSAYLALGLEHGEAIEGTNVEGTIGGVEATGSGQFLYLEDDVEDYGGIKIKVTMDTDDLEIGSEGSITLSRGIASQLYGTIEELTQSDTGVFDSRIAALEDQIEQLQEDIDDLDERLELRRESLLEEFYAMEETLAELQTIGDYLDSQEDTLKSNWVLGGGNG